MLVYPLPSLLAAFIIIIIIIFISHTDALANTRKHTRPNHR